MKQPEKADKLALFNLRLSTNLSLIQDTYFSLYPETEHAASFQKLLAELPKLFKKRSVALQVSDLERLQLGNWYQSEKMVGMQLYVDHFNKNISGLTKKLSYFGDLGVNFLHLMPITTRPEKENDGGYAVNSYTHIDPRYGTKKDFQNLGKKLREKGMYLMLDFVVNHTSDEFLWAQKAKKGDKRFQDFYYTFPDRVIPDEFEKSLPEVFPQTSPGNFTYDKEMKKWVMTVFNHYQWDLNYRNPDVFLEMLKNLVALANLGVDIVRFDALAFLWKKIGTISQNLPEAHRLVSLFRLCLQVVAPGVVLLAEAIVPPREIMKYFGEGIYKGNECEIAYNATLMALLWNSIATKETLMMRKGLGDLSGKPAAATWINYIRCHDDIGLGFDDRFIYEMGWTPQPHRKFLLNYYCQGLDWSPAIGYMFMYNPKTGDARITGSAASLLGLEKALQEKNMGLVQQSIDKINMLHGIILAFGGIPMIYGGDEYGALNDYSYLKDEGKKDDSRWVNRPKHKWSFIERNLKAPGSPQQVIYKELKHMIALRKQNPVFSDNGNLSLKETGNPHIFCFERGSKEGDQILVISNFDEKPQAVNSALLMAMGYGRDGKAKDLIRDSFVNFNDPLIKVNPYQLLWLKRD